MNLLEYIEALEPNTYIKVGADKGNGFIYCGKAGEFKEWFIEEKVNERERQKIVNIIEAKKVYLSNFPSNWKREYNRRTSDYKKAKEEGRKDRRYKAFATLGLYKNHLQKEKIKRINSTIALINRYEQRLAEFTPVDTRDVVETYDSLLLNEDGFLDHIVIFSGLEAAQAWDLTEFRHGVAKEDLEGAYNG